MGKPPPPMTQQQTPSLLKKKIRRVEREYLHYLKEMILFGVIFISFNFDLIIYFSLKLFKDSSIQFLLLNKHYSTKLPEANTAKNTPP